MSNQLQQTICSNTSGVGELPYGVGHHPITCSGKIYYDEDGVFSCEHYEVPGDDPRTHACLVHSVALMIVEEAMSFSGIKDHDVHK